MTYICVKFFCFKYGFLARDRKRRNKSNKIGRRENKNETIRN